MRGIPDGEENQSRRAYGNNNGGADDTQYDGGINETDPKEPEENLLEKEEHQNSVGIVKHLNNAGNSL